MNGSILVVGRVSGRIAELADSRHNVYGVGIYDKPQWLSYVDFYFWYKGYILFSFNIQVKTLKIIKNYRINWLKCQKDIDI